MPFGGMVRLASKVRRGGQRPSGEGQFRTSDSNVRTGRQSVDETRLCCWLQSSQLLDLPPFDTHLHSPNLWFTGLRIGKEPQQISKPEITFVLPRACVVLRAGARKSQVASMRGHPGVDVGVFPRFATSGPVPGTDKVWGPGTAPSQKVCR